MWQLAVVAKLGSWWSGYGKNYKDTQFTYNIILRLVRVTIVAVEEQKVFSMYSECL
jgi:hypothetical protein